MTRWYPGDHFRISILGLNNAPPAARDRVIHGRCAGGRCFRIAYRYVPPRPGREGDRYGSDPWAQMESGGA